MLKDIHSYYFRARQELETGLAVTKPGIIGDKGNDMSDRTDHQPSLGESRTF